jgi:hypothetical protein
MYTGNYFRNCTDYATGHYPVESIGIVSAKYGLLSLNTVIESYNQVLSKPDQVWSHMAAEAVLERWPDVTTAEILLSAVYGDLLEAFLNIKGVETISPLRGIGIGHRKHWLISRTPKKKGLFDGQEEI